jgi:hypothetical protein
VPSYPFVEETYMLNVLITVDVEIWCGSWDDLDRRFPDAFRRYIYGPTPSGQFGLEYQLRALSEHGLVGVFFVEPLFATRFGTEPLAEIVDLINRYGHEVQLHLHPEWASESISPVLPRIPGKRRMMAEYSLDEQVQLIRTGKFLLEAAGARPVTAFRAGSFGMNLDTLSAVKACGLAVDFSYNACMGGSSSGLLPGVVVNEPTMYEDVLEVPLTVFADGLGALHHAQIGACTLTEMRDLLDQAQVAERAAFVILSHNFELLNKRKSDPDPIAMRRFHGLCEFLAVRPSAFRVAGIGGQSLRVTETQPPPLRSSAGRTVLRRLEQLSRARFQ